MKAGASHARMMGPTTRLIAAIVMSSVLFSMHSVTTFYMNYFTAQIDGRQVIVSDAPLSGIDSSSPQSSNHSSSSMSGASKNIDQTILMYDEADRKRAIVIINTGEKACNTSMVERFVYSARKIGKFNGWIILITDADEDRYANMAVAALPRSHAAQATESSSRARSNLGDRNEFNKFLVFRTQEERFATISKFENFKAENTMSSKIFKTYILQYVNTDDRLDEVELFYYLDVDIVFGNPIRPLFNELEQRYKIGNLFERTSGGTGNTTEDSEKAKIFFFKGNGRQKIQGGQFILDRTRSQPCLDRWRQLMLEQRNVTYLKDQTQLTMMLKEQSARKKKKIAATSNDCYIKLMKQNNTLIQFPELGDITKWKRRRGKEHPVLVHFRNSARVMKNVDEESFERYMRELLRFKNNQSDKHGILGKMLLKVDRKDSNKTNTATN